VLFVAAKHLQRAALTLVNHSVLYLAFASHEDNPPYHGWVLAYSAANLQQLATYNDTPNSGECGIWIPSGKVTLSCFPQALDAHNVGILQCDFSRHSIRLNCTEVLYVSDYIAILCVPNVSGLSSL
jgi:hypothetical protein